MQSLDQLRLDIKAFFSTAAAAAAVRKRSAVVDYVRVLNAHVSIARVALEKCVLAA